MSHKQPTPQDVRVMDAVFGASDSSGTITISKLLIPGGLFVILSLPFIDRLLKGYITASDMIMLVVKLGIFLALLLIFQLIGWF